MKNNKKVIAIVALLLVAVIAFFAVRNLPKGEKAVDDNAVARSQEEEGDIHYIDDGAIALAGEAASTNTAGEAQATLALVNNQRAAGGLGGLVWNEVLPPETERYRLVDRQQRHHVRREPGEELLQRQLRCPGMDGFPDSPREHHERQVRLRRRSGIPGTGRRMVLGTGIRILI